MISLPVFRILRFLPPLPTVFRGNPRRRLCPRWSDRQRTSRNRSYGSYRCLYRLWKFHIYFLSTRRGNGRCHHTQRQAWGDRQDRRLHQRMGFRIIYLKDWRNPHETGRFWRNWQTINHNPRQCVSNMHCLFCVHIRFPFYDLISYSLVWIVWL